MTDWTISELDRVLAVMNRKPSDTPPDVRQALDDAHDREQRQRGERRHARLCARLRPLLERYVDATGDGCWLWSGYVDGHGYGCCDVKGERRRWSAHRMAFAVWKGPIPDGMLVCHTCDVALCCNPDHLYAGTYSDNRKDAVRRGRWALRNPARAHPAQRALTPEQTNEARELRRTMTEAQVAARFGVAPITVRRALRGSR